MVGFILEPDEGAAHTGSNNDPPLLILLILLIFLITHDEIKNHMTISSPSNHSTLSPFCLRSASA